MIINNFNSKLANALRILNLHKKSSESIDSLKKQGIYTLSHSTEFNKPLVFKKLLNIPETLISEESAAKTPKEEQKSSSPQK